MVDTGDCFSDLREAPNERLTLVWRFCCLAGVLAKSMLWVIEPRVASVGHQRTEIWPVRGGGSWLPVKAEFTGKSLPRNRSKIR